jgi:hypothetical protein
MIQARRASISLSELHQNNAAPQHCLQVWLVKWLGSFKVIVLYLVHKQESGGESNMAFVTLMFTQITR